MENLSALPNTLGRLFVGTSDEITGVAAGGDLLNLRTSQGVNLYALECWWVTLIGPTTPQEVAIEAFLATSWTTGPAVGRVLSSVDLGVDAGADIAQSRIAITAAVTGSVYVLGSSLGGNSFAELGAGVSRPTGSIYWCLPAAMKLAADSGIVVRNRVAMGAALSGRLYARALVGTL